MNAIIIVSFALLSISNISGHKESATIKIAGNPAQQVSITFPKNNQKVRGDYKIYGKAKPGAIVKLTVTSTYFKTAHDNQDRISQGEGPIKRMNRKFTITADRSGNWLLKSIELRNAGWEETFTITATAEGKTSTINVFDKVHPVRID